MSVYVDDARISARVGRLSARWSHLFADTPDELHAFAARLGLRRAWFQDKPHGRWHYDVTESKRIQAIRLGASAVTWREAVQIIRDRRAHGGPTWTTRTVRAGRHTPQRKEAMTMARNLAQRVTTQVSAPRVIHYVDPAPRRELILHTAAEVAAYRRQQRRLVARARRRHATIAVRDRKVRRFWLGFGAVLGLAVLTALVVLGWLIWTVVGLGVLAVPLVIALVGGLAVGGHRCITIVQHWH